MKKLVLLLVCLGLCGLTPALADVIYVSGDVSGTWSADSVIVTAEVRVPPGATLIIEPGVKVLFWVYCKFIVDNGAVLHAVGTVNDSILFDELSSGNRWGGLRFLNASDSSRLEYCHLIHGLATGSGEDVNGGAIYCSSSSPTIRNCLIDSCEADNGGGIYCYRSSPTISGNTISGNSTTTHGGGGICCDNNANPTISGNTISGNLATNNGGGICCGDNSSPAISGNTISGNSTNFHGGGISCWNSSPTISGNTITENSAYGYGGGGGGIYCYSSSPTISGNTISQNSATTPGGGGGGICCYYYADPTISGNTISGNSASQNGGGIYCDNNSIPALELNEISQNTASSNGGGIYLSSVSPTMNKNTIVDNTAVTGGGLYCTGSSPVLRNCILWGNAPQMIYQTLGSNTQVTYSDLLSYWYGTGNIFDDPLFVDTLHNDYHLQSESVCIDSGDPNAIYNDPDGTRADMGCYYFDQSDVGLLTMSLPIAYALHPNWPNPFNSATMIRYDVPSAGKVSLTIFNLLGQEVTRLVDERQLVGSYTISWDATNWPSGVYLCRMEAGGYVQTRKMLLVK